MCPTGSITVQCGLSAGKHKLNVILVCSLPRKLGTCANSVYQAVFPPPLHKCLGMRLSCCHNREQLFPTDRLKVLVWSPSVEDPGTLVVGTTAIRARGVCVQKHISSSSTEFQSINLAVPFCVGRNVHHQVMLAFASAFRWIQ